MRRKIFMVLMFIFLISDFSMAQTYSNSSNTKNFNLWFEPIQNKPSPTDAIKIKKSIAKKVINTTSKSTSDTIKVPQDYSNIQDAIFSSTYGDIILVSPGTYQEQIIMQNGVSLIGVDKDSTIIIWDNSTIIEGSSNATIEGFTIKKNTGSANIHTDHVSNLIIRNNIFISDAFYTIIVNDYSSLIVENNEFYSTSFGSTPAGYLTFHYEYGMPSIIRNNYFHDLSSACINLKGEDEAYGNLIENSVTGLWLYDNSIAYDNVIIDCNFGIFGGSSYKSWHGNANSNTVRMDHATGGISLQNSEGLVSNNIISGTLRGGDNNGALGCYDASPTIKNNLVYGKFIFAGFWCLNGSHPTVINNTFAGGENVVRLEGNSCPTIKNTIVYGGDNFGFYAIGGNEPFLSYNDIWGNGIGNYFNVAAGTCSIGSDPLFKNIYTFADTTISNGTLTTLIVSNSSKYNVGDHIEYQNDDKMRIITNITSNEITFDPSLDNPSQSGKIIFNWANKTDPVENFHLISSSPCIDAGDPSLAHDPDGTVSDMGAYYYDQSTIPTIISVPDTNAIEDSLYSYQLLAEGIPSPTFNLLVYPEGMTIDITTGLISWFPDNNDVGDTIVSSTATNNMGSDIQTFNLHIKNINDPPSITTISLDDAIEDQTYNFTIQVTDDDIIHGDNIAFSLSVSPAGMIINNSTGEISWLPNNEDVGDTIVTVIVNDDSSASDTGAYTLTVLNVNDPPVLSAIPDTSFNEDEQLSFAISYLYDFVYDSDNADSTLTWSLSDTDYVQAAANKDSVILSAENDWFGKDTVLLIVNDGMLSDSTEWIITVHPENDPPHFTELMPDSITFDSNVNDTLLLTGLASDIDSPDSILTWSYVHSSFVLCEINDTLNFAVFGVEDYMSGQDTVVLSVSDGELHAYDSLTIIVNPVTGVEYLMSQIPKEYSLRQNYPNPFNPITNIIYGIPKRSHVVIKIYDLLGREVVTLVDKKQEAKYYKLIWDAKDRFGNNVSSGMYFYRIVVKSGNSVFTETKKLLLLR